MQPKEIDDLISFAGHSSKDCEEFICKVTEAAFHECFLRDDERVAALAAAGLEGKALRWFEAIPTTSAVRTDWQLLRQYMLDEWSDGTDSESEDPPPSYNASLTEVTREKSGYVNPSSAPLASRLSTPQPKGGATAIMLEGKEKSWNLGKFIPKKSKNGTKPIKERRVFVPPPSGRSS